VIAAQRSQFVFDDGADEVVVDLEVAVHEDVAHTDDFSPRQVRLLIAGVLRQPAGLLADDQVMSDDPHLDEFVVVEDGPASVGGPLDTFDGFEDVLNAVRI
jgi:hypothetical protein